MRATLPDRVESWSERVASAMLGASVGFATYRWLGLYAATPWLLAYAVGSGALATLASAALLVRAGRNAPQYRVPAFAVAEVEPVELEELELTAVDRVQPWPAVIAEEPLVLDDVLAELGPDARVVRLFDRRSMPTPGQLKSRIDRHLGGAAAPNGHPDASQALSEALAELRRSLR